MPAARAAARRRARSRPSAHGSARRRRLGAPRLEREDVLLRIYKQVASVLSTVCTTSSSDATNLSKVAIHNTRRRRPRCERGAAAAPAAAVTSLGLASSPSLYYRAPRAQTLIM